MLILAGCGGSGGDKGRSEYQTITGDRWSAQVPAGWNAVGSKTGVDASSGKDFVKVATFPLARAYTAALFTRVESELAARMGSVAKETGGTVVAHRVVHAGGVKSHSYDVKVGDRTDTYTFVLRGTREYQLLCSASAAVCGRLLTSFAAS